MALSVCHDPGVVEIVGEPILSDDLLMLDPILGLGFIPVDQSSDSIHHTGHGFIFEPGGFDPKNGISTDLGVMTVYYRLVGVPGESSAIRFCDGELRRYNSICNYNEIFDGTQTTGPAGNMVLEAISTRNLDGLLTIREGEATRPERPPEPPAAAVYPEQPTSEEVNFRVRIGEALAQPGNRDVPVELYLTADVDYIGVIVPVDFDERYLRLARVEHNFLTAKPLIDSPAEPPVAASTNAGNLVLVGGAMGGLRRIAPAGEEFHAATLFFDVREEAAAVSSTALEVRPVARDGAKVFEPWVVVRHRYGTSVGPVEAESQIAPVSIIRGAFAIRAALSTIAGDANFDYAFNIADPLAVLGYLFQGESEPLCPAAADYDGDGHLAITDPIRMLGALFLGVGSTAADRALECFGGE
jgi:hypothetical protein